MSTQGEKNLQTAVSFFEDAEAGKGWEHCKKYCIEDPPFSGQSGAFHPPAAEKDLGGRLEGFVEWIALVVNEVFSDCHNTGVVNAYDATSNTALLYGCWNGRHTKSPKDKRWKFPEPTNLTAASDFVYKVSFNQDGKITGMIKIWNSDWFAKQVGWA